jgi:hypothetical protein
LIFILFYLLSSQIDDASDAVKFPEVDSKAKYEDDWNKRFQDALEAHDIREMYKIAVDFENVVIRYVKIIVPEVHLPNSAKTIQKWEIGGIAGGTKYKIRGIVFKLVQDPPLPNGQGFLYGRKTPNYEFAAKSAGHEIRSSMNYFRVAYDMMFRDSAKPDAVVRVPMQLMVDYRGFRILAMPFLPIKEGKTIIYGCDQSSRTMYNGKDHPKARHALMTAASDLHLARHQSLGRDVYCAGDCELHMGTDNRMYLLDLARAFPPEDPHAVKHLRVSGQPLLFRLLRPELLQKFKLSAAIPPLSPDAFTMWSADDPKKKLHNSNITKATKYLLKTVIPLLARKLKTGKIILKMPVSSLLHKQGINVRHMGLLLNETSHGLNSDSKFAQDACLTLTAEMVSRTLKNRIRSALRSGPAGNKGEPLSELNSTRKALEIMNAFIHTPYDEEFWASLHNGVKLRFGKLGAGSSYKSLHKKLGNPEMIIECMLYTLDMIGIFLLPTARRDFQRSVRQKMAFRFYRQDFRSDQVRVKKIGVFQLAIAQHLLTLGTAEMAQVCDPP